MGGGDHVGVYAQALALIAELQATLAPEHQGAAAVGMHHVVEYRDLGRIHAGDVAARADKGQQLARGEAQYHGGQLQALAARRDRGIDG